MSTHDFGNQIIVGVDGSRGSVDALQLAKNLGEALGREVAVLSCWQWPFMYDPIATPNWSPERDARQLGRDAIEKVYGDPDAVSLRVTPGPPAQILIDASRTASMLVVGTRGHGGFAGLLLGSVSAACTERAHCPVLVARATLTALSA